MEFIHNFLYCIYMSWWNYLDIIILLFFRILLILYSIFFKLLLFYIEFQNIVAHFLF